MNDEIEVFLDKVEAFAEGLSVTERAMLAHLVADESEDDVSGFNFYEAWPVKWIRDAAPNKIDDIGSFLSSGHTTGSGITSPGDVPSK